VNESTKGAESPGWLGQRERGAVWAIRLGTFWATFFGRRPTRLIVYAIAAYYTLFDRTARQASRTWFERIDGEWPSLARVYRHILCFAHVTLDRLFFARGLIEDLDIHRHGKEYLDALARSGTGAILLGAHLGSFDAMHAAGKDEHFPVTILGHFENAAMINTVLEQLDPDRSSRVLHIGRDPVQLALALRDRVADGDFIAVMADRVGLNDKSLEVEFFGTPARFSTGPFLLAAILKCPIYLVFGLYRAPNRYDLHCEPFAERVTLPRRNRQEALEAIVTRYAERLEYYCRLAPDNWFNFYDFWSLPSDERSTG
jgi:predicted LPLAT superfamily acyltransferase